MEKENKNMINVIIQTVIYLLILYGGIGLGELQGVQDCHKACNDHIVREYHKDTMYIGDDGNYYEIGTDIFIPTEAVSLPDWVNSSIDNG